MRWPRRLRDMEFGKPGNTGEMALGTSSVNGRDARALVTVAQLFLLASDEAVPFEAKESVRR